MSMAAALVCLPHRKTTGKNYLKTLFLSFLFSHSFLTQGNRLLALTSLNPLHQRVAHQPWNMIFIWKKRMAEVLWCTFISYKSAALEISLIVWNFLWTPFLGLLQQVISGSEVQLNEVLICELFFLFPFFHSRQEKREGGKERRGGRKKVERQGKERK